MGTDPAFFGLLAERGGKPVGYLLYSYVYDVDHAARVLHISDLYVREEARRQRIGTKLMSAAAGAVSQVGGEFVIWEVLNTNQSAIDFYKSLGGRFLPKSSYMFWNPEDPT